MVVVNLLMFLIRLIGNQVWTTYYSPAPSTGHVFGNKKPHGISTIGFGKDWGDVEQNKN